MPHSANPSYPDQMQHQQMQRQNALHPRPRPISAAYDPNKQQPLGAQQPQQYQRQSQIHHQHHYPEQYQQHPHHPRQRMSHYQQGAPVPNALAGEPMSGSAEYVGPPGRDSTALPPLTQPPHGYAPSQQPLPQYSQISRPTTPASSSTNPSFPTHLPALTTLKLVGNSHGGHYMSQSEPQHVQYRESYAPSENQQQQQQQQPSYQLQHPGSYRQPHTQRLDPQQQQHHNGYSQGQQLYGQGDAHEYSHDRPSMPTYTDVSGLQGQHQGHDQTRARPRVLSQEHEDARCSA
ncbi:hypothetical protein BC831DRAFT_279519 [Entophlyctis helioformis]|nr:hypothetical protein BC831DRAFT_279519 [Entophlyctis helioformis]